MAFTDYCDLYGAIHETGINLIVNHMMRQRPSLFNYGTKMFESSLWKLCKTVDPHPEVKKRKNPVITLQQPLPIIGAAGVAGLEYCFQIGEFKIDFHPGNQFTLPSELHPPLPAQQLALKLQVCGAISCPERDVQEQFGDIVADLPGTLISLKDVVGGTFPGITLDDRSIGTGATTITLVPLTGTPQCFCIDVYATAKMEVVGTGNSRRLSIKLEGLEIVDLQPTGLENSIECYLISVLRVGILPRLRVALDTIVFKIGTFASVSVTPTPTSASLPYNPAVEQDQVKVFINVGV